MEAHYFIGGCEDELCRAPVQSPCVAYDGGRTNLLRYFSVASTRPTDLFLDEGSNIASATEMLRSKETEDSVHLPWEPREDLYALPAEGSDGVEWLDSKELRRASASDKGTKEERAVLTSMMIALGFGRGAKRVPVCAQTSSSSETSALQAFLKDSSPEDSARNSMLPIEITLERYLSRSERHNI